MKIIAHSVDVHTHAFHPKIAARAVEQLAKHYGVGIAHNGLAEDLLNRLDEAGVERAFVHSAATKAEQVKPANDWAIYLQEHYPRFEAFGTIHPDFADFEQELNRLASCGIRGIKLHPDFQGFWLDDPRLGPIFECIGARFVLMVHIGDEHPPEENPSCPAKLARVLDTYPDLRVVAAHFGGYRH
ncbi:MAG: amidohydrolase family protein, partial [Kiritimatiellae bacterium]|nr:amidohydrolase family protein [Kiritimatiellia bacterium]